MTYYFVRFLSIGMDSFIKIKTQRNTNVTIDEDL